MLSITLISRELQKFWAASAPAGVPTQFPGVPLIAAGLDCWYEFWITAAEEEPQRVPGATTMRLLVDVHCFSRSANKLRVMELVDQIREGLCQQKFPLLTGDTPPLTAGFLRLRESQLRDLSREKEGDSRLTLQHLVVSLTAVAEAVPFEP
ncbi:hypothetical protein [Planctomicrobium sp. SH664]|uniref:hypothetical protein n=1 Tax=Planctomicrobium sp. SH664 TaxID=3448125 RepID=UPI003F5B8137